MAKKREENLTPSAVLETDIIRGLLGATDESVLFSIPDLRTRLNAPAQSFAGVVTFDDNVIVDGVTALNDALGVAGIATFADDLIIADGKTIGQSAGPLLTFDDTSNRLGITGCNVAIGALSSSTALYVFSQTVDVVAAFESGDTNCFITLLDDTTTTNAVRLGAVGDQLDLWAGGSKQVEIADNGGFSVNNLLGAAPGTLKTVYYNTATKELSYDNT